MGLDDDEILDALERPEMVLPDVEHDDRRIAVKGRLRVVYADTPDPVVCTVLWNGQPSREAGPTTAVPNRVSNRALLDKLDLWGCNTGRRRGDFLQVRTPTGHLIEVRPADSTRPNPAKVTDDIYRLLAVSPETFWSRTTRVRPTRPRIHAVPSPTPPVSSSPEPPLSTAPQPHRAPTPKDRGRGLGAGSKAVLDYFAAHPGEYLTARQVADAAGIPVKKTENAIGTLHRRDVLTKVAHGTYVYAVVDDEAADPIERLRAIAATRPEPPPPPPAAAPAPAPTPPVPARPVVQHANLDDEIDAALELLVPGGVRARHLPAAAAWVDATRKLLEAVRE